MEHGHPAPAASPEERRHLEEAYHELRTRLTSLRSNVELVHHELRQNDGRHGGVEPHLQEMKSAIDRLEALSRTMRAWHDARREGRTEPGGT